MHAQARHGALQLLARELREAEREQLVEYRVVAPLLHGCVAALTQDLDAHERVADTAVRQ
jgi:hypothetical protein